MSFLVKLVLGQGVVHPPPRRPSHVEAEDVAANDNLEDSLVAQQIDFDPSTGAAVVAPTRNGLVSGGAGPSGGGAGSDARRASPSAPAAAAAAAPSPVAVKRGPREPRPNRVPTRTLITRVQTCTVAQDIRDALNELLDCEDLPYVLEPKEAKEFVELLLAFPDDDDIVNSTMQLLATVTDITGYPAEDEEDAQHVWSEKEKRGVRDGFLRSLLPEVPLFLDHVKHGAFWTRFHSVLLLERLEEFDPSNTHRQLLSSHGIGLLVDILNDTSNDGMLRNEGLVLITSLTATDTELQTILAFENGFDSLFHVIEEEGGIQGGVIVTDCLTAIHNMLRGNKATQKFFREMGCARHLAPLLEAIPNTLKPTNPAVVPEPPLPPDSQACLIVLMSVSILSCVLKEADSTKEEMAAARESLLQCGLLRPLAALALCGQAIDDGTRIEALRTLATLLTTCKRAVEEFFDLTVATLTVRGVCLRWDAARGVLHYVFSSEDKTLLGASMQVLLALLSVQACQVRMQEVLLKRFEPVRPPTTAGPTGSPVGRSNQTSVGGVGGPSLPLECGQAFVSALLGSSGTPTSRYYAAQILHLLLSLPSLAEQLLEKPWMVPSAAGGVPSNSAAPGSSPLQARLAPHPPQAAPVAMTSPTTLPGNALVPLSTATPATFFNAFVSYVIFCLKGGHGSQSMDTPALSAYVRALFTFLSRAPRSVLVFVSDPLWYPSLLQQAAKEGSVHVRLWCAALAAVVCLQTPRDLPHVTPSPAPGQVHQPTPVFTRQQLLDRFVQQLGSSVVFENLLFDVNASSPQWSQPVANGATSVLPAVYDADFVAVLERVMEDFKVLCPPRANAVPKLGGPHGTNTPLDPSIPTSSTAPLPPPGRQAPHEVAQPSAVPLVQLHNPFAAAVTDREETAFDYLEGPTPLSVQLNVDGASPVGGFDLSQPDITAPTAATESSSAALDAYSWSPVMTEDRERQLVAAARGLEAEAESKAEERAAQEAERAQRVRDMEAELERLRRDNEELAARMQELEEAKAMEAERTERLMQQQTHEQLTQTTAEVHELRENNHMLEEALASKEEEQHHLVQSLAMLEERLRQVSAAAAAAASAAASNQQPSEAANASPSGPAAPVVPLEEVERLKQEYNKALAERDELLLMVAELDEECVSIRAGSAAITPAREYRPPLDLDDRSPVPLMPPSQHDHQARPLAPPHPALPPPQPTVTAPVLPSGPPPPPPPQLQAQLQSSQRPPLPITAQSLEAPPVPPQPQSLQQQQPPHTAAGVLLSSSSHTISSALQAPPVAPNVKEWVATTESPPPPYQLPQRVDDEGLLVAAPGHGPQHAASAAKDASLAPPAAVPPTSVNPFADPAQVPSEPPPPLSPSPVPAATRNVDDEDFFGGNGDPSYDPFSAPPQPVLQQQQPAPPPHPSLVSPFVAPPAPTPTSPPPPLTPSSPAASSPSQLIATAGPAAPTSHNPFADAKAASTGGAAVADVTASVDTADLFGPGPTPPPDDMMVEGERGLGQASGGPGAFADPFHFPSAPRTALGDNHHHEPSVTLDNPFRRPSQYQPLPAAAVSTAPASHFNPFADSQPPAGPHGEPLLPSQRSPGRVSAGEEFDLR